MGLKKAANQQHPAIPASVEARRPDPATQVQAAATEPTSAREVPAPREAASVSARPVAPVAVVRPVTPAVVAVGAPAASLVVSRGGGERLLPVPSDLPVPLPGLVSAEARHAGVSARGKQDVTFAWATEDWKPVQDAFRRSRSQYRLSWSAGQPGQKFQLSISPFTATAVMWGLRDPQVWLSSVRNDARRDRAAAVRRQQVGLVWPTEVLDAVQQAWEDLELADWPDGFALTKANLVAAAAIWAVTRVEDWLMRVPNDDRFSVPLPGDGRLTGADATVQLGD